MLFLRKIRESQESRMKNGEMPDFYRERDYFCIISIKIGFPISKWREMMKK